MADKPIKPLRETFFRKLLHTFGRFAMLLRPFWVKSFWIFIALLLGLLLQFPVPLIVKYILDIVVPEGNYALLIWVSIGLLSIAVLKIAIEYFKNIALAKYRAEISHYIRKILFSRLIYTRVSYFEENQVGYLNSRIDSDVDSVDQLFFDTVSSVILQLCTITGGLVIAIYLNFKLTLIVMACAVPYLFVYKSFSKRLHGLAHENREMWGQFEGVLNELIGLAAIFKSHNQEKTAQNRFEDRLTPALASNKKIDFTHARFGSVLGGITALTPLAVLLVGVIEIVEGRFTIGGLVAFSANLSYLFGPITDLVSTNVNLAGNLAAADRIFEIYDLEEESSDFGATDLITLQSIALDNVHCRFGKAGTRGLQGASFKVSRGESLAIIGPTGAGKSTIGKLLMGFNLPSGGDLLINGIRHNTFPIDSIRARIGYVAQEPCLFSGTILENILIGMPSATEEDVAEVLVTVHLDQWVNTLPDLLQTQILQDGLGISGGEKQRIALARALISRPDFLILDEASSALDPQTDRLILNRIISLPWNPGIIGITHRRAVAAMFDKVVEICFTSLIFVGIFSFF